MRIVEFALSWSQNFYSILAIYLQVIANSDGSIESILKPEFPEEYQKVTAIIYNLSSGWNKISNPHIHREVADDLTRQNSQLSC